MSDRTIEGDDGTVREVLQIGHPALRRVAAPVPLADVRRDEIQSLIDDLITTMRHADGAGLAATQIGKSVRIAVLEVADNPRYPYKPAIPLTVAINPVIELLDDERVEINEGCLSVPLRGVVERLVNIRITYADRDGAEHVQIVRGLTAATWQHECDHLDGILFVDKVVDPTTLATWDEYAAHHRDAFVERITAFVERIGS